MCSRLLLESCTLGEAPADLKILVKARSGLSYSNFMQEMAKNWAGEYDRFIWVICPKGVKHIQTLRFVGTVKDYDLGECIACDLNASNSTYRSAYPGLERFVISDSDLDLDPSKSKLYMRCANCEFMGFHTITIGYPMCTTCITTCGKPYGALVNRSPEEVSCEYEVVLALQSWLSEIDIKAIVDAGIVVPIANRLKPSYAVNPVIKPSLLLPEYSICIDLFRFWARYEINDNDKITINTAGSSEFVNDSNYMARRSSSLKSVGWKHLVFSSYDMPGLGKIENMLYEQMWFSNDKEEFARRVFDEIKKYILDNKLSKILNFSDNIEQHRKILDKEHGELLQVLVDDQFSDDTLALIKEEIQLLEADKIRYQRYISNSILI
jgi:hypothetical protein